MLSINQTFQSLSDFKEALRNWAIVNHFDFCWQFSDSQRAKANCVHSTCQFTVRCNYYADKAIAKVTVLKLDHNCTSNPATLRSQASRLDQLLGALLLVLTVDLTTPTKTIIDAINLYYSNQIKLQQAQRVKKAILNASHKQLVADYTKVLVYICALTEVSNFVYK